MSGCSSVAAARGGELVASAVVDHNAHHHAVVRAPHRVIPEASAVLIGGVGLLLRRGRNCLRTVRRISKRPGVGCPEAL